MQQTLSAGLRGRGNVSIGNYNHALRDTTGVGTHNGIDGQVNWVILVMPKRLPQAASFLFYALSTRKRRLFEDQMEVKQAETDANWLRLHKRG